MPLTEDVLRRMWPRGDSKIPGLIHGIAAAAPAVFAKYGIDSDEVIAQAMAQFSHECGAGLEMTENVNYTAERAAQVWPLHANDSAAYRHFSGAADCYAKCKSFPGDPLFHKKLISLVYGTRMGNRPGTDDGWNYIGRGLPQTTARDGYAALEKETGLPVLEHPELVNDPSNALLCGVADFVLCGCLPWAQRGNVLEVTKHLNGGTVGLAEREEWLGKWRTALRSSPPAPANQGASVEVQDATSIQRALNTLGYGPLQPDGKIGPKTQAAIRRFQADRGMPQDGIAGQDTIRALTTALTTH